MHGAATNRDPVCGMGVAKSQSSHSTVYGGDTFYFCSPQCQRAFAEQATLYTALRYPAHKGPPIPKRRVVYLAGGNTENFGRACRHLEKMPGVSTVAATEDGLAVEYDLQQVSFLQIEAVAIAEGLQLKAGLHRFRRDLWKFTERNELDNAARVGDGACCNRPPRQVS